MMLSYSLSPYNAALLVCYALLPFTFAHLEMSEPLPMRSRFDPLNTGNMVDYNLKSPMTANGSNYPCHGYQNDRPIRTTATYTAGQTYQMSVAGTVFHGGGSCQLSLSYDNGATFKVIKSMIGGCPLAVQYDFTIPSFSPSGTALFAWIWFNEIGNREMYMNCAHVQIVGSSATRRSRSRRQTKFSSMSSLPNIWRANIAGLDNCKTIEGIDMVYPEPGPDVSYGGSSTASSPVDTQSGCDTVRPFGQTYEDLGDSSSVPSGSSTVPLVISPTPTLSRVNGGVFAEGTTNSTPSTLISTTFSTMQPIYTTVPIAYSTIPFKNTSFALSTTSSAAIPTWTPTPVQSFNASTSSIPFSSTTDTSSYLPCVPGAFLCTSHTTYLICDQAFNATAFTPSSKYVGPLQVAAGMQCVPFLSEFPTPEHGAEFDTPAVPRGMYRSDRYLSL